MDSDSASGLAEYAVILRRRRWWIISTAVLAALASVLLSAREDAIYVSSSEVLVLPVRDATLQPVGQVDMGTEVRIAGSSIVANEAVRSAGARLDEEFEVVAENPAETETLEFIATSTDPGVARAAADAYAQAYIDFRAESLLSSVASATDTLEGLIEDLNAQIADATERLREAEGTAAETARFEISTFVTNRTSLESQLNSLAVAADVRVAEIIEPASDPEASAAEPRAVGVGFALGLLFGIGIAFVRERLDPRFSGRTDVEAATGAPVLALIPASTALQRGASFPHIDPYANEAFRALRARILHLQSQQPLRSVLVTSSTRLEGKGTTARNLALAIAEADRRVLLVAADFRAETPDNARSYWRTIAPGASRGLMDVLAGAADLADVVLPTDAPNLHIVPPGRAISAAEATLLANGDLIRSVLSQMADAVDIVVVDTTPVLGVSDALGLAPHFDAVLFTVDAASANRSEVEDAVQQLRSVGANVIGAVVTKVTEGRFRGYHHLTYGRPLQPSVPGDAGPTPAAPSGPRGAVR